MIFFVQHSPRSRYKPTKTGRFENDAWALAASYIWNKAMLHAFMGGYVGPPARTEPECSVLSESFAFPNEECVEIVCTVFWVVFASVVHGTCWARVDYAIQ